MRLREDLTEEQSLTEQLRREVHELHSKLAEMDRRYSSHIAILRNEIRRLGGNPDILESK